MTPTDEVQWHTSSRFPRLTTCIKLQNTEDLAAAIGTLLGCHQHEIHVRTRSHKIYVTKLGLACLIKQWDLLPRI